MTAKHYFLVRVPGWMPVEPTGMAGNAASVNDVQVTKEQSYEAFC